MENDLILKGLYPINTNNYDSDLDFIEKTILIIKSGIKIFQFRGKYLSFKRKKYLIKKIYENCQKNEVQLIINDDYNLVKWDNEKPDGIKRKVLDSSKLSKLYNNINYISLQQGLNKTIKWYIENKEMADQRL